MKISELFRKLSFGELSNLAISNSGSGEIVVNKQPQVIQYVNDGLVALYSRFVLSEKELILEQVDHVTQYQIKLKYTESQGDAEHLYIKDELNPFKDDLIKILQVYDASGCKLPLNDVERIDSLFTPQSFTLQVPSPIAGSLLSVIYQAKPEKLSDVIDGDVDILEQEFELPVIFENALQSYVAYKVFCHMNGQENIVKGQEHLAAYEAQCSGIEQRDLANQSFHTSHSKLEQRGFV